LTQFFSSIEKELRRIEASYPTLFPAWKRPVL